jgi:predicted metal-dependent hydrolase
MTAPAYTLIRSARRRRTLSLRVLPGGEVVVRAPTRTAKAEVDAFVARREVWIARRQAEHEAAPQPIELVDGALLPFLGRMIPLSVRRSPGEGTPRVKLFGEAKLGVEVPGTMSDARAHKAVVELLMLWYAGRLQEEVKDDLQRWAPLAGVQPASVRAGRMTGKWGTCSPDGDLAFNWRLLMVEPELREYVVVHELAHIAHHNHGPAFKALVARLLPDHAARRKRLRSLRLPEFV